MIAIFAGFAALAMILLVCLAVSAFGLGLLGTGIDILLTQFDVWNWILDKAMGIVCICFGIAIMIFPWFYLATFFVHPYGTH